jgi:hypothetical protein
MRKTSVVLLAMILAFASVAGSAQKIEDIPWDEAHVKQLRAAGKDDVFHFLVRQDDPYNSLDWDEPGMQWDDAWYPAGDGKYELAVHSGSGPDISYLTIYWQDAPGKIGFQTFGSPADATDEWYWNEKGPDLVDANGDGVTEVVYLDDLDYHPPPQRSKFIPGGMWPRVFRLQNGKYADVSRDFAAFYDKTIFPLIDKAMAKAQQDSNADPEGTSSSRILAGLTMCRDKILRVLGRDPNAGLAQAHEWMNSPDPVMVDNARVVFQDIGGHDKEVKAAKLATERASKNWPNKNWSPPP